MRLFASALLALAAATVTVPAFAAPPGAPIYAPNTPRKSPEFTITDPAGKQILISTFRGKVLVLPFMFTTCPHCQHFAQDVLTPLAKEFGPRGLVIQGTVFNDANGPMATQFVKEFNVGFPVGYASRDSVISYLSIPVMDRWVVPQVAVIDRKGNIVAQSLSTGTPELQDPTYLRNLVDKLLKESATGAVPVAAKKAAPAAAPKAN
jgi:peroxiredoxin